MTKPEQAPGNNQDDNLRHLPPAAREAFERFQTSGDSADLDPVIFAILEDFVPKSVAKPMVDLPGETRLMEDLGYDSLAVTELVFFTEDLFRINISNEEIIKVRTLDDLRGFILGKVADNQPG
jgi:acyl carrier protein